MQRNVAVNHFADALVDAILLLVLQLNIQSFDQNDRASDETVKPGEEEHFVPRTIRAKEIDVFRFWHALHRQ